MRQVIIFLIYVGKQLYTSKVYIKNYILAPSWLLYIDL